MKRSKSPSVIERVAAVLPRGRPGERLAVLFIDDEPWGSTFQLASGLRYKGIRTIRITTADTGVMESGLLFNKTIRIQDPSELESVADLVRGEAIADVQATESLALVSLDRLGEDAGFQNAARWSGRNAVIDKAALPAMLEGAPIRVPDQMRTPLNDPQSIVDRIGLPMIIKPCVGIGGQGIEILSSLEDVERAVNAIGSSDDYIFQRYVIGTPYGVGGVVTGAPEKELIAYEMLERVGNEFSPTREIRLVDEPELLKGAHALVPLLGVSGLLNMQFVQDSDGTYWLHDVNPRVWGPFGSFQFGDVDLLGAYVSWLNGSPKEMIVPVESRNKTIGVFPAAYKPRRGEDATAHDVLTRVKATSRFATWFGPRYSAALMTRSVLEQVGRFRG